MNVRMQTYYTAVKKITVRVSCKKGMYSIGNIIISNFINNLT